MAQIAFIPCAVNGVAPQVGRTASWKQLTDVFTFLFVSQSHRNGIDFVGVTTRRSGRPGTGPAAKPSIRNRSTGT